MEKCISCYNPFGWLFKINNKRWNFRKLVLPWLRSAPPETTGTVYTILKQEQSSALFVLLCFIDFCFFLFTCLFVLSLLATLFWILFCNSGAENGMKIFASFLVSLSILLVPKSFLKRLKLSSCLPSFSSVLKTDCVKVVTQISV